ncbi:hypothetical protein MMC25_006095 [Agyrium rufum]|nr:hypothetical protein [Agyrium rufum]
MNIITSGYWSFFGIYQLYYVESLQLPPSQISWIGSIQMFLTFFLGTFSGRLADAGYARHAVLVGLFLITLGTFMTSLATSYWQILLAQGVCTGIGMGILSIPTITVVGSYFKKYKAMALGFCASGSGTGSIIWPLLLQNLQPRIGFGWAVRVQGLVVLMFAILINLLLRPRAPPRKSRPLVDWQAFREPPYSLFAAGLFLIFWALYFGNYYINIFATREIGLSDSEATNLLILINVVGIPVRPVLGLLADRCFGVLPTLIVSATILGALLYVWTAVQSATGLYVWAVFYGVATGATLGLFIGGLASLTDDISKMGTRFRMIFSILGVSLLIGPPTAGALIQNENGGSAAAQVWSGTVTIAGAVLIGAARWTQRKK